MPISQERMLALLAAAEAAEQKLLITSSAVRSTANQALQDFASGEAAAEDLLSRLQALEEYVTNNTKLPLDHAMTLLREREHFARESKRNLKARQRSVRARLSRQGA